MTKPIYTNAAVAKLTANIAADALSIVVDNASNFPEPTLGSESFWMTLVGNVSQATEIVECTGRVGTGMTIIRGQQGTVAQAFSAGDQAYHALTAEDASRYRDAMYYYLGTHASDPSVDNYGGPLVAGMLYFNSTIGQQREFNGSAWQQFGAIVNLGGLVESTWDAYPLVPQDTAIDWVPVTAPSDNGNNPPVYDSNLVFNVYSDGVKLIPVTDFTVAAHDPDGYSVITIVKIGGLEAGTLSISQADSVSGGYIPKDDEFASDWGALGSQADINNGLAGKLADGSTVKSYADAGDAASVVTANAYTDGSLVDAKDYTDEQVLLGPKIYSIREANAETILPAGEYTRVDFAALTAEDSEAGMTYDPVNGIQSQFGGAYRVSGSVGFRIDTVGDTVLSAIIVVGTDPSDTTTWKQVSAVSAFGDGTEFHTVLFNRLVRLEAGEFLNVYARNSGYDDTLTPSGNYTFLDINYVGNAELP